MHTTSLLGVGIMLLAPLALCLTSPPPSAIYHPAMHQQRLHYLTPQIHSRNHGASHHRLSSSTSGGDNMINIINEDDDTADDLTKEELLLRLSETLAYYRERPEEGMTQSAVCLKILSTRLPNLRLNRSFVAESTIPNAGYGLFATRDINDGELITLFPGDAVLSKIEVGDGEDEDEGKKKTAGPICSVMFGAHTKLEDRNVNRVLTQEAREYETEISTFTSIVGDWSIGFDDVAYIGHFANDGGYLRDFDDAGRRAYQKETLERYNAANFSMEGAHMGLVATKPIKKGAEVFLSYGEGYWLSRVRSDSNLDGSDSADILVEIERNMEERRKNKRATTLTALGVGRSSDVMKSGGGVKAKDGKRNKKKKKKSRGGSASGTAKGFGI